jgi:peptidyl-prolyl cis-trans isomerase D
MSLLESMRSGTDSTFMQVVLGAVVLSFVFWYAAPQGDTGSVVATVNGSTITGIEFSRVARQQKQSYESRSGQTLSDEDEASMRENIRDGLVERELVIQAADEFGVEVSDTEIARNVLDISAFADENGRFDRRIYTNMLRAMGYNQTDFEHNLRGDLMREKMERMVRLGGGVSTEAIKSNYREQNTTVEIEFLRIRTGPFLDAVVIDDAMKETWIAENAQAIKERYDADFDRMYNTPESISLQEISLVGEGRVEKMAGLIEKINGGADFTEVAIVNSQALSANSGGDLGSMVTSELGSDMLSALEGVEVGGISSVVESENEVRIYKLVERSAVQVVALESVTSDIATLLMRAEEAPALAAAFAEKALSQWKSGALSEELLASVSMATQISEPLSISGDALSPFGPPAEMLKAAGLAQEGGTVLDRVFEQDGTLYVGELKVYNAPDMEKYAEDEATMREALLGQQGRQLWQAWVDSLKANATVVYNATI